MTQSETQSIGLSVRRKGKVNEDGTMEIDSEILGVDLVIPSNIDLDTKKYFNKDFDYDLTPTVYGPPPSNYYDVLDILNTQAILDEWKRKQRDATIDELLNEDNNDNIQSEEEPEK